MDGCTYEVSAEGPIITVKIAGRMRAEDAGPIIDSFEKLIPHDEDFELHLQIPDLAQYDSRAREMWVESLQKHRQFCKQIVLYGARPVIRMVASTVALVLRVPVEFR